MTFYPRLPVNFLPVSNPFRSSIIYGRTLWGEHEQAALNRCVAEVLPVKYQNTAHRLWYVAKQGLLSLYCLQKCLSLTA